MRRLPYAMTCRAEAWEELLPGLAGTDNHYAARLCLDGRPVGLTCSHNHATQDLAERCQQPARRVRALLRAPDCEVLETAEGLLLRGSLPGRVMSDGKDGRPFGWVDGLQPGHELALPWAGPA